MTPLIINDVPITCINYAAVKYHIPAILIISVLKTENGRIGSAIKNKNGSYDFGPMQINGCTWLHRLRPYGISQHDLQYDSCINVAVGTWILAKAIASDDKLWHGIGRYNSNTASFNQAYRFKVQTWYQKINHYLQSDR